MAKYSPEVRSQALTLQQNLERFGKQQEAEYDAMVSRLKANWKARHGQYQDALRRIGIKGWDDAREAGVRWEIVVFSAIKF